MTQHSTPEQGESRWFEGQRVIHHFRDGLRSRTALQEIVCEVVDPRPFRKRYDHEDRLRVRCVDERDAMNGMEFIPLISTLRPASEGAS